MPLTQLIQQPETESLQSSIVAGLWDQLITGLQGPEANPVLKRAHDDFESFVVYDGGQLEPAMQVICQKLMEVEQGICKRLMVFMPPRTGKSYAISRKFPAWYLGRHPDRSIILTSYDEDLALDFSYVARNTLEEHRELFPKAIVDRRVRAKKRWGLLGYPDSGLIAAGVRGPITGRGCHIGIIDDPFKDHLQAYSEATRKAVWNWYQTTFMTRLVPNGAIILVMTRWHEDDLAGRLIERMETGDGDQWDIISLPAIAEKDDPLGRAPGTVGQLTPRYSEEEILKRKSNMDPHLFAALFQQRPRPEGGDYFRVNWFVPIDLDALLNVWEASGNRPLFFSACDFAIDEKSRSDWNVIVTGALTQDNEVVLVDVRRFKGNCDAYEIADQIIDVQMQWKPMVFGFEEGMIRKSIWAVVKRRMQERNCFITEVFLTPITDKRARARAIQARMRQGNVYFPKEAEWFPDFEDELLAFPNAKWDDQVDAFAWLGIMLEKVGENFDIDGLLKAFRA